MHLVYPPEFCITIVSNISPGYYSRPKMKSKTMVIQSFEGVNKEQYGLGENREC